MHVESGKIVYFREQGPVNTSETLRLAKERADIHGIRKIIVASHSGETGAKASKVFKDYNPIVVTAVVGAREPDVDALKAENKDIIEKNGGKIVRVAHAFGTLGRAVNRKFGNIQVDEIIANVLRLFSQGVKVGCEVACMAVDAGLISTREEAIAIGGTRSGADTAIVVKPSNTHTFFDMRIREIICKPR